MTWVVMPAAGQGTRVGGPLPKQYLPVLGQPLIVHTLQAVLAHPDIDGVMVVLAANDTHWPGIGRIHAKPVSTCIGGAQRAQSVRAGLLALPASVGDADPVLVHDAARPCITRNDITRLIAAAAGHSVGALLGAPVRDTLKHANAAREDIGTASRDGLWRVFTPQLFARGLLTRALEQALAAGIEVSDEAMAIELLGLRPLLVEGREDNIKVTTQADFALAEFVLRHQREVET
ncbi:MAG: 2-C-methyl-D-erythritol 4-phosphate cytidylyltransferase [Gammaproteobacteria bacterium HGW-Gammaproteobacteria-4]|jgi:2-C-methyl-D-erythritol 4-phosphate cytidylyltransferase|nr:MAG: 2-C-methyl-D-erythritol 4-phosphate cytidylyltransferase [Gammaproteobacteria bacterium HGW-Gammaproteobacteria-4]